MPKPAKTQCSYIRGCVVLPSSIRSVTGVHVTADERADPCGTSRALAARCPRLEQIHLDSRGSEAIPTAFVVALIQRCPSLCTVLGYRNVPLRSSTNAENVPRDAWAVYKGPSFWSVKRRSFVATKTF